jgi:Rieske Fe-S protein
MSRKHPAVRRRTVLKGAVAAGAAAAAAPALASCSPSAASGTTQAQTVSVKESDVPVGGGVVEPGVNVLVVQPTTGVYRAYSAICPHQGCTVGAPSGGLIVCPCHGSTFRVSDGSVVNGPATQGLMPLTATVKGGSVVVS